MSEIQYQTTFLLHFLTLFYTFLDLLNNLPDFRFLLGLFKTNTRTPI